MSTPRSRIIFESDIDLDEAIERIKKYRGTRTISATIRECIHAADIIQRNAIGSSNDLIIRNRKTGRETVCPVALLIRDH